MRILHVFKDYYPPTRGGIEQHIHDIVHGLDGFDFAVLTSSRSKALVVEDDHGVKVVRARELFRPASTPITPQWRRLLRESGASALHFHMPNPFGELAYLASRVAIPMIASYHADIVGRGAVLPVFDPFRQMFLRKASKIVTGSPSVMETSEALRRHRDRVSVIPYGIDAEALNADPARVSEIRDRLPGPLVLFAGRLVYYKGVEVLIEAMQRVEATLVVVGDGPRRADLEQLAANLRPQPRVAFEGAITDADRTAYYEAADVFVLPSTSRAEAFGISMLEAMACGTPAVSTELGTGTSWVNVSGETGIVVDPGDPAALAGAVKALLRDETRREEMGRRARSRAREDFSRDRMLASLAGLYRSLETE